MIKYGWTQSKLFLDDITCTSCIPLFILILYSDLKPQADLGLHTLIAVLNLPLQRLDSQKLSPSRHDVQGVPLLYGS